MQGQEQGEHPSTAVQTVAEKAKFEREALMYLITPEQRRELGGLSHTQVIDVNRWAVRWNEDVGRTERDVKAGRMEPIEDPSKQINRKKPHDLSYWWTESKKGVNTARTIENNRPQLHAMRESLRIRLDSPATETSGAVGVTFNGRRFSFPFVNDTSATLPRPSPSLAPVEEAPCEQEDAGDNDSSMDVDGVEDGGGTDQGGGLDDGGSSSGPSGPAGGTACAGSRATEERTARVGEGDGAYVVPAAACSTQQSVAPAFGRGLGFASAARVWNPLPPVPSPPPAPAATASTTKRLRSCQVCGHNSAKARWKSLHTGGGRVAQKVKVCSVPEDLRRKPDKPGNKRNRFKGACECNDCK